MDASLPSKYRPLIDGFRSDGLLNSRGLTFFRHLSCPREALATISGGDSLRVKQRSSKDSPAPGVRETQGMTLLSEEKTSFGELQGGLYSASQAAQGIEFSKWMAIFGDATNTYIVTAAFPKVHAGELSEKLKAAVHSAKVSGAAVDPLEAVPFRVKPAGSMKLAKVIGNMLLFTNNGVFPARGVENPLFVAAASLTQSIAISHHKQFAEARLLQVQALKEITPKETNPFEVAGLKGFESTADALDAGTGEKAVLYQAILAHGLI